MRSHLLSVAFLAACGAGSEPVGPAATAIATDTGYARVALGCGPGAPGWTSLYTDVFYEEEGPRLTVFAVPYDPDGGIHDLVLEVWADHWVDGQVTLLAEPRWSERTFHGDAHCGPAGGEAYLWDLHLPEQGFREGGVELALRLVDVDGNASEFRYVDLCLWGSDEGCAAD